MGSANKDDYSVERAKAWCFDNNITTMQIQSAWDNALSSGNFIIKNLSNHGFTWTKLPPHLLKQLIERYYHED